MVRQKSERKEGGHEGINPSPKRQAVAVALHKPYKLIYQAAIAGEKDEEGELEKSDAYQFSERIRYGVAAGFCEFVDLKGSS